ncbi:MAG: hypothetical protein P1V97_16970 [Planctomycetota bacterium]|nr:hypothetical protein [Planctomycetota bacterium]
MTRLPLAVFLGVITLTLAAPIAASGQEADSAAVDSSVFIFEGEVKRMEFLGGNEGQNVHKAQIKIGKVIQGDCPPRIEILISNPMEIPAEEKHRLRVLGEGEEGRFKVRHLLTENDEKVYQLIGSKDDYEQLKAPRKAMPAPLPLVRQKSESAHGKEAKESWLSLMHGLGIVSFLLCIFAAIYLSRQDAVTEASPYRDGFTPKVEEKDEAEANTESPKSE